LRIAAVQSPLRKRRKETAAPLGQHWHEKSSLSRHALCRGADRAGNREYDPPATLDAFRDHGRVRASLEENVDRAGNIIDALEKFGISLKEVTDQLLHDGLASFEKEFEKLLSSVKLSCK
jgi:transaldolase/fructose-6-phosphate aldolase-like protein